MEQPRRVGNPLAKWYLYSRPTPEGLAAAWAISEQQANELLERIEGVPPEEILFPLDEARAVLGPSVALQLLADASPVDVMRRFDTFASLRKGTLPFADLLGTSKALSKARELLLEHRTAIVGYGYASLGADVPAWVSEAVALHGCEHEVFDAEALPAPISTRTAREALLEAKAEALQALAATLLADSDDDLWSAVRRCLKGRLSVRAAAELSGSREADREEPSRQEIVEHLLSRTVGEPLVRLADLVALLERELASPAWSLHAPRILETAGARMSYFELVRDGVAEAVNNRLDAIWSSDSELEASDRLVAHRIRRLVLNDLPDDIALVARRADHARLTQIAEKGMRSELELGDRLEAMEFIKDGGEGYWRPVNFNDKRLAKVEACRGRSWSEIRLEQHHGESVMVLVDGRRYELAYWHFGADTKGVASRRKPTQRWREFIALLTLASRQQPILATPIPAQRHETHGDMDAHAVHGQQRDDHVRPGMRTEGPGGRSSIAGSGVGQGAEKKRNRFKRMISDINAMLRGALLASEEDGPIRHQSGDEWAFSTQVTRSRDSSRDED